MRIALLTNEFPPHVYGGAGVHVEYLSQELEKLCGESDSLQVLSFGDQKQSIGKASVEGVRTAFDFPFKDPRHLKVFDPLLRNLVMAGKADAPDVVHCHTWYTHFAGCLVRQLHGAPLVLTTHSLEPHRPWKVEQLGTGYHASAWLEETAYRNADGVIAVSDSMRRDVHNLYDVPFSKIRVIPNGIDPQQYRPTTDRQAVSAYGVDPDRPFILFVGRITRQKGIIHLVSAIRHLDPGVQIVLCAGAPDTPEIGKEMEAKIKEARQETSNSIIWIPEVVPKERIIPLYSHAAVFVCPSVYEPFGIINLEAMACATPVVASAVGGIPEVVAHGETGLLVPFEPRGEVDFEPREPEEFQRNLAAAINSLLRDDSRREAMGRASRDRVERTFSWSGVAQRTLDFYRELTAQVRR